MVIFKYINPDISPILAKLFNLCLMEKSYPSPGKISSLCLVFNTDGAQSSLFKYQHVSRLSVFGKLSEAAVNENVSDHLNKR